MNTVKRNQEASFVPYRKQTFTEPEMAERSAAFYTWMDERRSVRDFSSRPIPKQVIENIIKTASTAPSGAHKQPWTFCVVTDPEMKWKIRIAAEAEEFRSYHGRMNKEWLNDLKAFGTDWHKSFLEIAPALIVVFRKNLELDDEGNTHQTYYVQESCGIAVGFLLAAIHHAGLVALTHTPSPMNFLCDLLKRPSYEKPFVLIPVGYPDTECQVPDLKRKELKDVMVWY